MKVLIVKTSSMGDIIHALPLVHDLTAAHPDAEIHWLAEESFRDIPTFAPAVSSVHRTAFRRWRRTPFAASVREEIGALKSALRKADYDAVLDIQGLLRSAVAARWTGKPVTGYTRRTVREPLASWFYDKTLDLPESLGAVRRYRLAAAEAFGYAIDEEHPVFALRADRAVPLPVSGPYAALAVNTSRDEKLWPEAHWVRLSEELLRRGMRSVIFWGNPEERLRAERIAARIEGAFVPERMPLADVGAVLAGARLMVGVDTGLAHLAAALGRPSVGIFVSTPTETLRLIGDGPCLSLGGVGEVPTVEAVLNAADAVTVAH